MSQALTVLPVIFWGVIVLSVLVFAHEAGHFLCARISGVRVTEFFLGLPCRFHLSKRSRTRGTEYGITPILLGGYTRICGMSGSGNEYLASILAGVQKHGRVAVEELASEVGCTLDEAYEALAILVDWASVEPYYNPELGEYERQDRWPQAFQTVARDSNLLTIYDAGHNLDHADSYAAGTPQPLAGDNAEAFFETERSHTYQGASFPRRLLMLFGGPLASFLTGALLIVIALSVLGMDAARNVNVVGTITEGSPAAAAGLEPGDVLSVVDGTETSDFNSLAAAISDASRDGEPFEITYERNGETYTTTIVPDGSGYIGITAPIERLRMPVQDALAFTFEYSAQVIDFAVRLFIPTQTMEVMNNASSVVGISVMASEAAAAGPAQLVLLAAAVSLSLAFMNLIPIPPLDGGKIVIEIIGAIRRKPVSVRAQNIVSMAGLAFFVLLFVVALQNDITRLMG